jgi:hypothetical protein
MGAGEEFVDSGCERVLRVVAVTLQKRFDLFLGGRKTDQGEIEASH